MNNTVKTVSKLQAAAFFAAINNPQPVGIVALTEVKVSKDCPLGRVLKLSHTNGFIGDYENMVNNQLAREGNDQLTFTAKPRKWGKHVSTALVEHVKKGEVEKSFYLSVKPLKSRKPVYLVRGVRGWQQVAKAIVAPFLPEERHAENQGTEKEIYHRDYSLDSLVQVSIAGQKFRIR